MPAIVDDKKCKLRGACVAICPVTAITLQAVAVVDENLCIDCGVCVAECPEGALSLSE